MAEYNKQFPSLASMIAALGAADDTKPEPFEICAVQVGGVRQWWAYDPAHTGPADPNTVAAGTGFVFRSYVTSAPAKYLPPTGDRYENTASPGVEWIEVAGKDDTGADVVEYFNTATKVFEALPAGSTKLAATESPSGEHLPAAALPQTYDVIGYGSAGVVVTNAGPGAITDLTIRWRTVPGVDSASDLVIAGAAIVAGAANQIATVDASGAATGASIGVGEQLALLLDTGSAAEIFVTATTGVGSASATLKVPRPTLTSVSTGGGGGTGDASAANQTAMITQLAALTGVDEKDLGTPTRFTASAAYVTAEANLTGTNPTVWVTPVFDHTTTPATLVQRIYTNAFRQLLGVPPNGDADLTEAAEAVGEVQLINGTENGVIAANTTIAAGARKIAFVNTGTVDVIKNGYWVMTPGYTEIMEAPGSLQPATTFTFPNGGQLQLEVQR